MTYLKTNVSNKQTNKQDKIFFITEMQDDCSDFSMTFKMRFLVFKNLNVSISKSQYHHIKKYSRERMISWTLSLKYQCCGRRELILPCSSSLTILLVHVYLQLHIIYTFKVIAQLGLLLNACYFCFQVPDAFLNFIL